MSAQHTKGPWRHVLNKTNTSFLVLDRGSRLVCSMSWHHSSREHYPLRDESEANARLIAAAPELLSALEEAVRINHAVLILADGIGEDGQPFTEAQKLDARAFLARRRANWLSDAIGAIAKVNGSQP